MCPHVSFTPTASAEWRNGLDHSTFSPVAEEEDDDEEDDDEEEDDEFDDEEDEEEEEEDDDEEDDSEPVQVAGCGKDYFVYNESPDRRLPEREPNE